MSSNDTKKAHERAEILANFAEKLSPGRGLLTWQQAYDVFKEIEAKMEAVEDDAELYNALLGVRKVLMESMEVRSRELGKEDEWVLIKKFHDGQLMLAPLLRARDSREFSEIYRGLSQEQRDALEFLKTKGGLDVKRLEREARRGSARQIVVRRIAWVLVAVAGIGLLVSGNIVGLLLLGVLVMLWKIYESLRQRRYGSRQ